MIQKIIVRLNSYILLTFMLLLLTGCIGGGGGSASGGSGPLSGVSSLNQSGGGEESAIFNLDPSQSFSLDLAFQENGDPGQAVAKIHNPEPTTILLFGSGVMAYGTFRKRKNSR